MGGIAFLCCQVSSLLFIYSCVVCLGQVSLLLFIYLCVVVWVRFHHFCLFICVLLFGSGFVTFVYLSVCCCFGHNDVTYAVCLFEWQGGETWMPDAYTLLNQQHRESKRSERPGGFLLKVDVHVFRKMIHTLFFSFFCVCVCIV